MRQMTLVALAVVTVPVFLAVVLAPASHGTAARPIEAGPVFPTLGEWLGKATKLSITSGGAHGAVTINLARTAASADAKAAPGAIPADGWTLTDKGGYPVQSSVVQQLLAGMLHLKEVEPKTERPKLYGRLDLDDPTTNPSSKAHFIELSDANGASIVKLIVGRRRYEPATAGGGDTIYVRKPDEPRSWSAKPAFDVPGDPLSWIDRKVVDVDNINVKSVTLTATGGKPLVLTHEKAADKFEVKDLPKDAKLKGDNPGSEVASTLRYLDLSDVRPAAQVTAPAVATAEFATFDGLTVDVTLSDQDGSTWLTFKAAGTGDAAKAADEITARTKGWAYQVPESKSKALETTYNDLVQPPPPVAPAAAEAKPEAKPAKPAAKTGK